MAKKTKAVVVVRNGYVTTVFSDDPKLDIEVVDRDALEQDGLTSEDSAGEVAYKAREMTEVYSN